MHIVIGLITALAGLFWAMTALQRAGFNIASLNPFAAWRRWQWKRKVSAGPLKVLKDPRELAAVLLVATAKCEGDLTGEQKSKITELLVEEVGCSRDEVSEFLISASHLTSDGPEIAKRVQNIITPLKEKLTDSQSESIVTMMNQIAEMDSPVCTTQQQLIERTQNALAT